MYMLHWLAEKSLNLFTSNLLACKCARVIIDSLRQYSVELNAIGDIFDFPRLILYANLDDQPLFR